MNAELKRMLSNKRQREGKRQPEPSFPPGEWADDIHAGFAFTAREEQQQRQNREIPPAYDYNALEELPTAHQGTAESLQNSDPINSNFYAAGDKIRPWAHARVPSYLAIAEIEAVSDDEFMTFGGGKLEALGHVVPQMVGGQGTIDITPLIPEPEFTTYGAENSIPYPSEGDGYLYA